MAQNTSHAVMAQRKEPLDSLDDFPTPPWATRALIEEVFSNYWKDKFCQQTCLEPACNRGYMSKVLLEYFLQVSSSDVNDYGCGYGVSNFLDETILFPTHDWIITNPPFKKAEEFICRALETSRFGVAMLTRTSFLEGVGRFNRLFNENAPTFVAQFSERVPMVKGRYDPKASTATSYCWLVWMHDRIGEGTEMLWIPPCRKQLERISDYA
jgi:hypothetical protein